MKKWNVLIAPDSFKGSISAVEISKLIHNRLLDSNLPVLPVSVPLADGGEGSLGAIMQVKEFQPVKVNVSNPQSFPVEARYLVDRQNNTAYIELAQASGLALIKGKKDVMHATTFGTGQLIKHAVASGISKIVLFLGGSATCDAGLGIAYALGIQFYDSGKNKIFPSAENLSLIASIDDSLSYLKSKNIEILLAVDVNNPFYGPNGASYVYSPQKGANLEQVKMLDKGLKNFAGFVKLYRGIDLQNVEGSGAAGGTAGGLYAIFGAKIIRGTEFLFDLTGLEEEVRKTDLIISGEGKIDSQSLNNKLLYGISEYCVKYRKRFWVICGYFDGDEGLKSKLNIEKVFSLADSKAEIKESINKVIQKLNEKTDLIINDLKQELKACH